MHFGYTQPLFILAFDHRATFYKHLFKTSPDLITPAQHALITDFKNLIFAGVTEALTQIPMREAAILVDEQYGDAVLKKAQQLGLRTLLATEKSGQKEFAFEYENFAEHIEKYTPTFAKALIHYNPDDPVDLKTRQQQKLTQLSDYCHAHEKKFLLEVLIDATEPQLRTVNNSKDVYDLTIRPNLAVQLVAELQVAGVEPDVWKMEGLEKTVEYEKLVAQIRAQNRNEVSLVILGRGATDAKVEQWIRAGANVAGVIGFAVGRTIFWDAIAQYYEKNISVETVHKTIGEKFVHFYNIFKEAQKQTA